MVNKTTTFYKWELVILLWLAFFFNQADRQIFNVVLPLIKEDLKFSDAELGLIASALIWTYGLLVPVAGFAGDFFRKKKIIVISLLFWSIATMFTGLGHTVLYFVFIRGIATGGGEAFYAPTANSLISEQHTKSRSFALSLHQTAVYFGIISSGWLAGYIGEQYGWRNAFYAFGGFGILLAIIIQVRLKGREAINGIVFSGSEQTKSFSQLVSNAKIIFQTRSFWWLTGAFACMVFVNTGYLTWMPSFLYEKYDMTLSDAGFSSMFYHHVGAFLGVLFGGKLSDMLVNKWQNVRPLIQMTGLLCGAPFIYLMAQSDSLLITYVSLAAFGFFRGMFDCNIFGSLFDVVAPHYRSSAAGLMLMIAFLISAITPVLLGVLKPTLGLGNSLSMLSMSYVLGAVLLFIVSRFFYRNDIVTVNVKT
ncbi:MFS transporter [uncultured Algoriphagus sp.]|uniref:MFS transporter n=1 Tax=uncultured Algoriphagus sp. TaxID=417365 RepID=UPI0030ECD53D|tara:strand:- start:7889 stop:9148 length:1260 start_codon:yes stop_codon:yes gene_type:complete